LPWAGAKVIADGVPNNGVANSTMTGTGGWQFQIMPYIELDTIYRSWTFDGNTFPAAGETRHLIAIPTYLCPMRDRDKGFKTGGGITSGPMTDYAINTRINFPATNKPWYTNNRDLNVEDFKMTLPGIGDGTSNTILCGQKAQRIQKFHDDNANSWDESIVQGGNGGFARCGNFGGSSNQADMNTFVLVKDSNGSDPADPPVNNHYGGPYQTGVLFAMCDGSIRMINYSIPPDTLCYMLHPNDGKVADY
jgi:hypothetical protein